MRLRRSVLGAAPLGAAMALALIAGAAHAQPCDGSWSALGQGLQNKQNLGSAYAQPIVFDDSNGPALYALGHTDFAGGQPVDNFAKWDGQSWTVPPGGGLTDSTFKFGGAPNVFDALVFDDGSGPSIFAGGMFGKANGQTANGIAKWNGQEWSVLGSGVAGGPNPQINAMTTWDPDGDGPAPRALIVGGSFESVSGLAATRVAMWDGQKWSNLGAGIPTDSNAWVMGLAVFDAGSGPALYAGVYEVGHKGWMYWWDGQDWQLLEPGPDGPVDTLAVHDDGRGPALYVGGPFEHIGGIDAVGLARWDGHTWEEVGGGLSLYGDPEGMATVDLGAGPELVVFGAFDSAGNAPAGNIASWNGERWATFDGGLSDPDSTYVMGVSAWDDGSGPGLFAMGEFSQAGDREALGVARYGICPPCYADFTGDGSLDLFDFLGFVNAFNAGEDRADCTHDGTRDLFDFLCFVNAFNQGC